MKKLLTTIVLTFGLIIGFNSNAFAQEGPIKIGGGLVFSSGVGLGDLDNDIGLRVEGIYPISEQIRGVADFTFFFPKEEGEYSATVLGINFNGHYIFYAEDELTVYGLGGINIAILNVDGPDVSTPVGDFGGSASETEFGLNLGGGIEYALDFGDLFGELKFAGVGGDADQLVFGFGTRIAI